MRYAIIALITMATLLTTLPACSGQAETPDPTSAAIASQIAQVPEPTPRPTSPPPTRPKRIENIATLATEAAQKQSPPTIAVEPPTQAPAPTSGQKPASQPTVQPSSITQPAAATTPQPAEPAQVPPRPQFTDEVLLQEIYENVDLDRLALPDDYQIPPDYSSIDPHWRPIDQTEYEVPYYDVYQHPYLHVFPTLEYFVKKNADSKRFKDNFKYEYRDIDHDTGVTRTDATMNPPTGISHFLHYPWFEPFWPHLNPAPSEFNKIVAHNYNRMGFHFGNNSTRGVLADTVSKLMEEAAKPGIRSQAIYHPWAVPREHQSSDLGEYLRTPFQMGFRSWLQDKAPQTHVLPVTRWEIIHPELPIVQVTSYSTTMLPLTETPPPVSQMTPEQILERLNRTPKVKEILEPVKFIVSSAGRYVEKDKPEAFADLSYSGKEDRFDQIRDVYKEHKSELHPTLAHLPDNLRRWLLNLADLDMDELVSVPYTTTHYGVSFVISFQNRWESFTDPNRWLLRFHDDLSSKNYTYFQARVGAINDETNQLYPYYWHTTDYMQHRIIGPVVLNVYDSEVLEPGVYSMTPRINHWPAPGYIVKDDRQLFKPGIIYREGFKRQNRPLIFETFDYTKEQIEMLLKEPEKLGELDYDGRTRTFGRLRIYPSYGPNPGFPLPGHVLTNPTSSPGTPWWERYNLDDNKW